MFKQNNSAATNEHLIWLTKWGNVGRGGGEGFQHFITTSAGIRKELWAIAGHRVTMYKSGISEAKNKNNERIIGTYLDLYTTTIMGFRK